MNVGRLIFCLFCLCLLCTKLQAQDYMQMPAYIVVKDSISKKEILIKNDKRFSLELKNGYTYIRGPFVLDGNTLMSGDSVVYSMDTIRYLRVQEEKDGFTAFVGIVTLPVSVPFAMIIGETLVYSGLYLSTPYFLVAIPIAFAAYYLLEAYGHFHKVDPHMQLFPALAPPAKKWWNRD